MPDTDKPNTGGRPPIVFNDEALEKIKKLLEEQATDEEIAAALGVHRTTLTNHKKSDSAFTEAYENGKARGKTSLRSLMWEAAKGSIGTPEIDRYGQPVLKNGKQSFIGAREPNITMQIFLAKNTLGMSDRQEISGSGGKEIVVKVVRDG